MSFLTATLLTFHICYVPLHLAIDEHDGLAHAGGMSYEHHQDGDHDDDAGHVPHASADHTLAFVGKPKVAFDVLALPISALGIYFEPHRLFPVSFAEPSDIPKEFPPDPLQPRAPPAV